MRLILILQLGSQIILQDVNLNCTFISYYMHILISRVQSMIFFPAVKQLNHVFLE